MKRIQRLAELSVVALVLAACGGTDGTTASPVLGSPEEKPVVTRAALGADAETVLAPLRQGLDSVNGITSGELLAKRAVEFKTELGYDVTSAVGLDKIQGLSLKLNDAELERLKAQGFVISNRLAQPSFSYGYSVGYFEHLPVFVSADSILDAVHRSYDNALKAAEQRTLRPTLVDLLTRMRTRLTAAQFDATLTSDLDLYLTVAAALLEPGKAVAPGVAANAEPAKKIIGLANAASGTADISLFGSMRRDEDFSQFAPRGHYAGTPELESYFRAMMWMGRIDARLIEAMPDGSQVFRRRATDAAVAMRLLMEEGARADWDQIDAVITAFVGEHDSMTPVQVDALLASLGVTDLAGLAKLDDQAVAQAIVNESFGKQRILSTIITNETSDGKTLPLSSSFALFGQRYVVDSHVFSSVVYDRAGGGTIRRMMPDPLDVAYAALGNNQAAALLKPELTKYPYAPDLEKMRFLVDSHESTFWNKNLYNRWLASLRTLSPESGRTTLPSVAVSEAWGRRLLSTQLASWAELRHDTILYAKQSYTSGVSCEYPDAYIDPYPKFFAAVGALATHAVEVATMLRDDSLKTHFEFMVSVAGRLERMAKNQESGAAHSQEDIAFINEAVKIQEMCGGAFAEGWYPKLVYGDSTEFDPTIADVHTQPTDESGARVGRVLHVGTGAPRMMVVTMPSCSGARAYVGPVFSYFEKTTEDYKRLTDDQWSAELDDAVPPDPTWLSGVVVR